MGEGILSVDLVLACYSQQVDQERGSRLKASQMCGRASRSTEVIANDLR